MRILIAVSGDEESADTVEAAASFPWPAGSVLRVITVAEKVHPSVVELVPGGSDVSDVQRSADVRAGAIAASFAAKLRDRGLPVDSINLEGDPKSVIPEHAKEWAADLIVVGSNQRSAIARLLLGSVSQAVVTHATCSVLVVRPKQA